VLQGEEKTFSSVNLSDLCGQLTDTPVRLRQSSDIKVAADSDKLQKPTTSYTFIRGYLQLF